MDGHAWSRPGAVLLLAALLSSAAAPSVPLYFVLGEPLVVTPPASGLLSHIVWELNRDLVVEWDNNTLDYFRSYKEGRANLNLTTGELVIKDTTKNDTGTFSVKLNRVEQRQTYQAEAIRRVSKPEVQVRTLTCSTDSTSCTLTCFVRDPTGAGPVTYSWRNGPGPWGPEQKSPDFLLENNEETQGVKTISCLMKNPVGEEESDTIDNPFIPPNPGPVVGIVLGVLFLIIVAVAVVVGVWKRQYIKNRFCPNKGGGDNADPEARYNSAAAADKADGSVTQPLNGEPPEVPVEKGSDPESPPPAANAP